MDQHFGELLEWLNQRGEHPPFRVMKVLDRGAYDNFFDLGGHSLSMIQSHSKLRAALGREFPIVKLFEFPTVRLIAERLSREAGESPAQSHLLHLNRYADAPRL